MIVWLQVVVLLVALSVGTAELGYRLGRRVRSRSDEAHRTEVRGVQASTLGLLALLLGFTLSMAAQRFADRREMIIDEANAIGTTYLRAELLPPPRDEQSRALLRDYAAARYQFSLAGEDDRAVERAVERAKSLQRQIWAHAKAVGIEHPDWEVLSSYLTSLNEMIDLELKRRIAARLWLPQTIFLLLISLVAIGMGITGFANGLSGRRTLLSLWLVPILTALACTTVIDLDHPRAGLIRAKSIALEELMSGMAEDTGPVADR